MTEALERTLKCVLLAEDNSDDVFLMQRACATARIPNPIQVVEDGLQVRKYLSGEGEFADRRRFPLPCLVLLDLKLPHLTGLEVLEWIKHESKVATLPVIMLSSSAQLSDIDRAYRLGANSYLVKPTAIEQLCQLVQAIKQYWLDNNYGPPIL